MARWVTGAGAGIWLVLLSVRTDFADAFLRIPLALVILLAAGSLLYGQFGYTDSRNVSARRSHRDPRPLATGGGAGIGLAVSLTSGGAGALGMALLTRLSPPGREPRELVGTDLMFAVPIALVAGVTYSFAGLVEFHLLLNLLAGSIPGVLAGSLLGSKFPASIVTVAISVALVAAGVLLVI